MYSGKAYQAIAAYNAGPTATRRWIDARGNLEPEFWIETVPYKETRDYIPRVLAFSVVYDWRLKQPVRRISQRMTGEFTTPDHVAFQCPQALPATKGADKKPAKLPVKTR